MGINSFNLIMIRISIEQQLFIIIIINLNYNA